MKKTALLALLIFGSIQTSFTQTVETTKDTLVNVLSNMDKAFEKKVIDITNKAKALQPNDNAGMEKLYKEYSAMTTARKQERIDFIKKNPSSHSIFLKLPEILQEFDRDDAKALYQNLPSAFKQEPVGKQLYQELYTNDTALVIVHPDKDGKQLSLASYRGKYVLVDFWASWCGPCMREVPTLVSAYASYKNKGFEIFGISLDNDKNRWLNAISTNNMNWVQTSDLNYWNNAIAKQYGIRSIPASFLLDKDGKIIAKDLRGDELLIKLEKILGK